MTVRQNMSLTVEVLRREYAKMRTCFFSYLLLTANETAMPQGISGWTIIWQKWGLRKPVLSHVWAREIIISQARIATEVICILLSRSKPELNLYLTWYRNVLPLLKSCREEPLAIFHPAKCYGAPRKVC